MITTQLTFNTFFDVIQSKIKNEPSVLHRCDEGLFQNLEDEKFNFHKKSVSPGRFHDLTESATKILYRSH